ncbi:MAG: hypothetical protein ACP5I3_11455 [Thermoproteus sp.]
MLLAFLSKGICGGGCGNLGQLANIIAKIFGVEGKPYLAECDFGEFMSFCYTDEKDKICQIDYLVIRLKTNQINPDEYNYEAVTKERLNSYLDRICSLLNYMWELERQQARRIVHAALLTTNPYLRNFSLGRTMTPNDIVRAYYSDTDCGRYIRDLNRSDIVAIESPFLMEARNASPKIEPLCI